MMNNFWNWSHTDGSASNHRYGFGLYPTNDAGIGNADPHNLTYTIGHKGADYGSTAQVVTRTRMSSVRSPDSKSAHPPMCNMIFHFNLEFMHS